MAIKKSAEREESNRDIHTDNLGLAKKVRDARKRAGLSQIQLSQIAGVSPKTVAKLEKTGIARVDAIVRVAKALGEPIELYVGLAGHKFSADKIQSVLDQQRVSPIFPQLSPKEYFQRTIDRLTKHEGLALRCVCATSPLAVAAPSLQDDVMKMMEAGLQVATVVPFPLRGENVKVRLPALSQYYTSAYNWAYQATEAFRRVMPAAKDRVHIFVPRIPDGQESIIVPPPVRDAEIRPMLTQYGFKEHVLFEFGAFFHFYDNREDHWIDIYSSESSVSNRTLEVNERALETFQMWRDYFRDILNAWHPTGKGKDSAANFDVNPKGFWQLAEV